MLEIILKNSESVCTFKAPDKCTLFFSYDNIQTLLKSHRIGGNHQRNPLAVVVCSILCLAPDGITTKSEIQYSVENTPANWYADYKYDPEKKIVLESLSSSVLKDCIGIEEEEYAIFNEYFERELQDAIDFVENDMDENLEDTVTLKTKVDIAKKESLTMLAMILFLVLILV